MGNYYGSGDGLGLANLGQAADTSVPFWDSPGVRFVMTTGSVLSVPALAYHGYKRNRSVGWALVWGIFGSMVWPVTVPVAVVQGYAKPKVRSNKRRRRTSRRRRRTSRRS